MDYHNVVEFSTPKSFWNFKADLHDSYKPHVSTMASLQGSCSSMLLFPSISSTSDNGSNGPVFKRSYQQTFVDEKYEGGAGIYESCFVNASACSAVGSSQCSWISGTPDFSCADGAFQDSLMQQSSYRHPDFDLQLVTKQLNASDALLSPIFHASMSLDLRKIPHDKRTRSQQNTTTGFTKFLYGAEEVFSDHNVESFGRPTIVASDESKNIKFHEVNTTCEEAPQSVSGIHRAGDIMHNLEPRRKRSKTYKHGDEVESQRMTHIAVERNRRKQMSEHLFALRSLMPDSFIQKGDQASIIGGAIEFVRELEQLLHYLQAQKRRRLHNDISNVGTPVSCPLAMQSLYQPHPTLHHLNFISSQRVAERSKFTEGAPTEMHNSSNLTRNSCHSGFYPPHSQPVPPDHLPATLSCPTLNTSEIMGKVKSDQASVEVKMVRIDQALLTVLAPRRSGLLLRTVMALESLALTVLHIRITTVHQTVTFSFHIGMDLQCRTSADEIATILHGAFSSSPHSLQFAATTHRSTLDPN